MYFTDSVIAAAQFTCYNRNRGHMFNDDLAEKDKVAYVLSEFPASIYNAVCMLIVAAVYKWNPPER